MNSYSVVTVDMSAADYESLLDFLRCCADVTAEHSNFCDVPADQLVLADLAADFRFFCDLLDSNRR